MSNTPENNPEIDVVLGMQDAIEGINQDAARTAVFRSISLLQAVGSLERDHIDPISGHIGIPRVYDYIQAPTVEAIVNDVHYEYMLSQVGLDMDIEYPNAVPQHYVFLHITAQLESSTVFDIQNMQIAFRHPLHFQGHGIFGSEVFSEPPDGSIAMHDISHKAEELTQYLYFIEQLYEGSTFYTDETTSTETLEHTSVLSLPALYIRQE